LWRPSNQILRLFAKTRAAETRLFMTRSDHHFKPRFQIAQLAVSRDEISSWLDRRVFCWVDCHVLRFAEFRASWFRANCAEPIMFLPRTAQVACQIHPLAHDPEKCVAVFRKDHAQTTTQSALKPSRFRNSSGDYTKENARGERAFSVVCQLGGSWVFQISTWLFGGLVKDHVNSRNCLLPHHRSVRTGNRNGLAGLDDARGLRIAVIGRAASRNTEAHHGHSSHKRNHHDLEVGRTICAVDRMIHGSLPPALRIGMTHPPTGS